MKARRKRFSDRTIRGLAVDLSRTVDFTDEITPGLVCRVTPKGTKGFGFKFRWQGKTRRLSLGQYPTISLAEARERVDEARRLMSRGIDPVAMVKPQEPTEELTFADAVERWAKDRKAKRRRAVDAMKRVLEIHIIPELGARPIQEITRRDVVAVLEGMRDSGLTAQVNRAHRAASGVFRWALNAGEIEAHPVSGLEPLVAEESRAIVLSVDQLATLWKVAGEMNSVAGPIVRLLILTAARREEVTAMTWREIDFDGLVWKIPETRNKGKRPHTLPLSGLAASVLRDQPQWAKGRYVFSASSGSNAFAGWVRAAAVLRRDAQLVDGDGQPVPWKIHDIRRSVATALGEHLEVSEEMVARILGHSKRTRMGAATATYERSERLDQMRSALEAWAGLLGARAGIEIAENVVPLPARGRGT